MSLGTLGSGDTTFVFEASDQRLRTWQDMRRSGEARWAQHDVYGAKPKKEFIGPGLDSITFTVRLDTARGVVPKDELKKLRLFRDTGAVNQLILGEDLVGDFVLRALAEDHRRHDPKGNLITAIAELTLEEYA